MSTAAHREEQDRRGTASGQDIWQLRIYVAGKKPRSLSALNNLQRICNQRLKGRHRIEVIDLAQEPERACGDQIVAIPTILRSFPLPSKKIVGDLSNSEELLLALDIPVMQAEAQDLVRAISTGQVDAFVCSARKQDPIVALQGTDEPYRLLVESMNEGALTLAEDGTILYCNSRFAHMVNRSREDMIGSLFQHHLPADEQPRFATLLAQGLSGSSRGEFTLLGEQRISLRVQLSLQVEACDNLRAVSLLVSDITELKQAEEALQESRCEQLRMKDEFLSHVSHELRSPLTAIDQFVSILSDGLAGPLNTEQREYLQITARNVRQLHAMIEDLLEITRAESGKLTLDPQWTSARATMDEVIHSLSPTAAAKQVLLCAEAPVDLPLVYADPGRLRQILTNLVQNAIKFTSKGHVRLQAEVFEPNSDFLLFEVEDTGCGLQPDVLEKVFDRLYQLPTPTEAGRKGLGIGLYICKELVKRQRGRIWVQSEPGRGSRFFFTLPVASMAAILLPLIGKLKSTGYTVALFSIAAERANCDQAIPERLCQELRHIVQRCTLPDLDVLLPNMGGAAEQGRCFVLAVANEGGAKVLAQRLHEQLQVWEKTEGAGLSFRISYTLLPLPAQHSPEDLLKILTREAENLMAGQTSGRAGEDAGKVPCVIPKCWLSKMIPTSGWDSESG